MKQDSGGGLTKEENDSRMTIEDELEKLCPHFDQIHALLGERANINPRTLRVLGMVDHDSMYDPNACSDLDEDEDVDDKNDDDYSLDAQGNWIYLLIWLF